jgi:heme/copper-type cytochrome/quinol oxidase subunit 2
MISVVATLVFFVLMFHAFYKSTPARTSGYVTAKAIILPARLLQARGIYVSRVTVTKASLLFSLLGNETLLGLPTPGQIGFQTPATPIMEGLIDLHHDIMFFLVFIIVFVLYLLIVIVFLFHANHKIPQNTSTVAHHTQLEIIWTIIPTIILIFIAVPSFALLYSMDELQKPTVTLKAIGRQ